MSSFFAHLSLLNISDQQKQQEKFRLNQPVEEENS